MSGKETKTSKIDTVEELEGLENIQQMEVIADHYARVSNQYEPVKDDDFKEYLQTHVQKKPPNVGPYKV